MRGVSRTFAVLALIVALAIPHTLAHSYLTSPISRSNQKQSNNGCRGPACLGPCDVSKDRATTAAVKVQRGQTINVQWPRNNHPGGFIRLAWAPWGQSDSHSAFDDGVQKIVCHEVGGCKPDDPNNPNGGDSGPADGSRNACSTTITVPENLADGKYTLQWIWYGGGFALGDYYSCVDYEVSGGPTGSRKPAVFQGGDYTYPNQQKCKFFNTNAPHVCVNEPCANPPSPGERSGAPAGFTGSSSSGSASSSSGSASSSSGSVPPSSSSSGSAPPSSSSSGSGSTSGSSSSSGNGQCTAGMTNCKKAPQTTAQYQCCSPGAQCFNSGDFGVCCGVSTVGCIYGSGDSKQATCCDTRYLKCDAAKGCVNK